LSLFFFFFPIPAPFSRLPARFKRGDDGALPGLSTLVASSYFFSAPKFPACAPFCLSTRCHRFPFTRRTFFDLSPTQYMGLFGWPRAVFCVVPRPSQKNSSLSFIHDWLLAHFFLFFPPCIVSLCVLWGIRRSFFGRFEIRSCRSPFMFFQRP